MDCMSKPEQTRKRLLALGDTLEAAAPNEADCPARKIEELALRFAVSDLPTA